MKQPAVFHKDIPNTLDGLAALAAEVEAFLEAQSVDAHAAFAANLACEELVSNTIKYGYDDQESHVIGVRIEVDDAELRMTLTDDGHIFNPFTQPEPDTTVPLEERGVGGLGIHFVKNLLDSCRYERTGGINVITVTKTLA